MTIYIMLEGAPCNCDNDECVCTCGHSMLGDASVSEVLSAHTPSCGIGVSQTLHHSVGHMHSTRKRPYLSIAETACAILVVKVVALTS